MPFWPEPVEYAEAVQSPQTSFNDPELQSATAEMAMLGPLVCSGNFASVYHLIAADGQRSWAIKCFTKRVTGQQSRYQRISQHLESAKLQCAVDFQYQPKGIRIRGEWFPILKMDWVDGLTLFDFVDQNIDDHRYIGRLYSIWLRLEPYLRSTQTVHGDLQHGNVLLVPGQSQGKLSLRVIDYDGLWAPDLAKTPSGEAGHSAYQHPERQRRGIYSKDIDRFPHLVIAAALRTLSRPNQADLWRRFQNGDNLLFTKRDFENPGSSELLHQLWTSGSSELQNWAGLIAIAATSPLEATPRLEERLTEGRLPALPEDELARAREILGATADASSSATDVTPDADATEEWWERPLDEEDDTPDRAVDQKAPTPRRRSGEGTRPGRKRTSTAKTPEIQEAAKTPAAILFVSIGAACVLIAGLVAALASRRNPAPTPVRPPEVVSTAPAIPTAVSNPPESSETADFSELHNLVHDDGVLDVAFSPDGETLATASSESVHLWKIASGRKIQMLTGHAKVKSVAFSPDGSSLASADHSSGSVKIWDLLTGQEKIKFRADDSESKSVAFSPDGRRLATTVFKLGLDEVQLWDVENGQNVLAMKCSSLNAGNAVFSPDGKQIAWVNESHSVEIRDPTSGAVVRTWSVDPLFAARRLEFSPDGTRLAGGRLIWDAATGEQLGNIAMGPVMAFSPDGKQLVSLGSNESVCIWDASNQKLLQTLKGHTATITRVAWSPQGNRLASASHDRTVKIWQSAQSQSAPSDSGVKPVPTTSPPFYDPDWDPAHVRELASFTKHTDAVTNVAFSPDGKWMASASRDRTIHLRDVRLGRDTLQLTGHNGAIWSLAFSPDSLRLASASDDGMVKVWSPGNGEEQMTLNVGNTQAVRGVAFSPDGKQLASTNVGGVVNLWDAISGQHKLKLTGHVGEVNGVVYSPDGLHMASISSDKFIIIWDAADGSQILKLEGHTEPLTSVAYSLDGKRLASASQDRTVKIWDATSGVEMLTLKGNSDRVRSVAFSPSGPRVASASDDGTVKVWNTGSGQCLTLKGHTAGVLGVTFSPDGKQLASASEDRTVKLWGRDKAAMSGPGIGPGGSQEPSISTDTASPQNRPSATTSVPRLLRSIPIGYRVDFQMTADNLRLITLNTGGNILLWDLSTGQQLSTIGSHAGASSIALSKDGRVAITGGDDGIQVWDVNESKAHGSRVPTVPLGGSSLRVAFSSTETELFVSGASKGYLLRAPTDRLHQNSDRWLSTTNSPKLSEDLPRAWYLLPSPDKPNLAYLGVYANFDKDVYNHFHLFDITRKKSLRRFIAHNNSVVAMAISADGKRLLTQDADGMLIVWDTQKATVLKRWKPNTPSMDVLGCSPDGQHVLVSKRFDVRQEWHIDRQIVVNEFQSPDIGVSSERPTGFKYLADNRTVLVGQGGQLEVWELPRSGVNGK